MDFRRKLVKVPAGQPPPVMGCWAPLCFNTLPWECSLSSSLSEKYPIRALHQRSLLSRCVPLPGSPPCPCPLVSPKDKRPEPLSVQGVPYPCPTLPSCWPGCPGLPSFLWKQWHSGSLGLCWGSSPSQRPPEGSGLCLRSPHSLMAQAVQLCLER